MSDDKPYILATETEGGGFVPFSYHRTRESALRRLKKILPMYPAIGPQLNVYRRVQSGVYRRVTEEDV